MVLRVDPELPIGTIARRTGLAVSAIRFYEERGLIAARRDRAGRRVFPRSEIRRLSFIRILQQFGFSLTEIRAVIGRLPDARTPTEADWRRIAGGLRADIDARIATLERLRNDLDGCIGCGCLSLKRCALYNRGDAAARHGGGPRYLMGDKPESGPDPIP